MTQQTLSISQALELAAQHLQRGNFPECAEICRQIALVDVGNADALHLLALSLANQGQVDSAVAVLEQALSARPDDFELHNNHGNLLKAKGDLDGALAAYQRAIALKPDSFELEYNLGNVLLGADRFAEAVVAYQRTIELRNDFPEAHYNLALAYGKLSAWDDAVKQFKRAIALRPDFIEAQLGLAATFATKGDKEKALNAYRVALSLDKNSPVVHNNLGVCLTELGQFAEAKQSLQRALELQPNFVEAMNNLAVVNRNLGEYNAAIGLLQTVLQQRPGYVEAYRNLGQVYAQQAHYRQAIDCYERAIAMAPTFYEAWIDLAVCQASSGANEAAVESFEQAHELNPQSLAPLWGACMAKLPSLYSSEEEVVQSRQNYERGLTAVRDAVKLSSSEEVQDAADAIGILQPFFLYLQGQNDRALNSQYGELVCKIMAARYPEYSKPLSIPAPAKDGRLRVGIVSRHFSNHSDWRVLIGGMSECLDRKQFRVFGFSTGGKKDEVTDLARKQLDVFVEGLNFEALAKRIRESDLHVLIFPELGMDPETLKLAALRLAPVQCVAWARPETSGLSTVDYFLSSQLMEPENSAEHYSEKLVTLPNMFMYYAPANIQPKETSWSKHGGQDKIRFVCSQLLYKYLPQYDAIYPRIAKEVPNAHFLFFSRPAELADSFYARLRAEFAKFELGVEDHVTMLPYLSHAEFLDVVQNGYASLDSIGFSGCLTTLDSIQYKLPIVTMRGALMRGRQTSAMLEILGAEELVANSIDEYVGIAIELAKDPSRRDALSKRIADGSHLLYRDYEAMNGLAEFIKSVV